MQLGRRMMWLVLCLIVLAAGPAQAKIELTIMGAFPKGTPPGDLLDSYIEEYKKLHPEIEIIQVPRTGEDQEAMEKILISIAAGNAPDIVFVPQVFLNDYVKGNVVQPVPAALKSRVEAGYLPSAMQLAMFKGVLYGFPAENQPQALAYNARVFAEAGLPDAPPEYWNDIPAMARKLTKKTADNKIERAGFGIPNWATPVASYLLTYAWQHGYNPISDDLRSVSFNKPQVLDAIRLMKRMLIEDETAITSWESWVNFGKDLVAMFYAHGPWQAMEYRTVGPAFYEQTRTALPPKGSTGKHEATFYGYLWAVTPYTKHQQESYDFLIWLCNEPTDARTTRNGNILEALGSVPNTYLDMRNQPSMKEPFMQGFLQALSLGIAKPIPPIPYWIDSFVELANQYTQAIMGQISEAEAMLRVDRFMQQKFDAFYGN